MSFFSSVSLGTIDEDVSVANPVPTNPVTIASRAFNKSASNSVAVTFDSSGAGEMFVYGYAEGPAPQDKAIAIDGAGWTELVSNTHNSLEVAKFWSKDVTANEGDSVTVTLNGSGTGIEFMCVVVWEVQNRDKAIAPIVKAEASLWADQWTVTADSNATEKVQVALVASGLHKNSLMDNNAWAANNGFVISTSPDLNDQQFVAADLETENGSTSSPVSVTLDYIASAGNPSTLTARAIFTMLVLQGDVTTPTSEFRRDVTYDGQSAGPWDGFVNTLLWSDLQGGIEMGDVSGLGGSHGIGTQRTYIVNDSTINQDVLQIDYPNVGVSYRSTSSRQGSGAYFAAPLTIDSKYYEKAWAAYNVKLPATGASSGMSMVDSVSGTTPTVNLSELANLQTDDLLFAGIFRQNGTASGVETPGGWSKIVDIDSAFGSDPYKDNFVLFARVYDIGEGSLANLTFNFTDGGTGGSGTFGFAVRGASVDDIVSSIVISEEFEADDGTSFNTTSHTPATPTLDGMHLLCFSASGGMGGVTLSDGYTGVDVGTRTHVGHKIVSDGSSGDPDPSWVSTRRTVGAHLFIPAADTGGWQWNQGASLGSGYFGGLIVGNGFPLAGSYRGIGTNTSGGAAIFGWGDSSGKACVHLFSTEQTDNTPLKVYLKTSSGSPVTSTPGTPDPAGDYYTMPTGSWFNIKMQVSMNTPGLSDGFVKVWIDNVQIGEIQQIKFRNTNVTWGVRSFYHYFSMGSPQELTDDYTPPATISSYISNVALSDVDPDIRPPDPDPDPDPDPTPTGDWELLHPGGGGFCTEVAVSSHTPGRAYRGDDNGGLWVTNNYGSTWTYLGFNLRQVSTMRVVDDPNNINKLYVGTEWGLHVSGDGGDTFDVPAEADNMSVSTIQMSPWDSNFVMVGPDADTRYNVVDGSYFDGLTNREGDQIVVYTTNGGTTWSTSNFDPAKGSTNRRDVTGIAWVSPTEVVIAHTKYGLYRGTYNSGTNSFTWANPVKVTGGGGCLGLDISEDRKVIIAAWRDADNTNAKQAATIYAHNVSNLSNYTSMPITHNINKNSQAWRRPVVYKDSTNPGSPLNFIVPWFDNGDGPFREYTMTYTGDWPSSYSVTQRDIHTKDVNADSGDYGWEGDLENASRVTEATYIPESWGSSTRDVLYCNAHAIFRQQTTDVATRENWTSTNVDNQGRKTYRQNGHANITGTDVDAYNNYIIYTSADTSVIESFDNGVSFAQQRPSKPSDNLDDGGKKLALAYGECCAIVPSDPTVVLYAAGLGYGSALANAGFLYGKYVGAGTDFSTQWTLIAGGNSAARGGVTRGGLRGVRIYDICYDPEDHDHVVIATDDGLWECTDLTARMAGTGGNFSQIASNGDYSSSGIIKRVLWQPGSGKGVVCASSSDVLKGTKSGASWTFTSLDTTGNADLAAWSWGGKEYIAWTGTGEVSLKVDSGSPAVVLSGTQWDNLVDRYWHQYSSLGIGGVQTIVGHQDKLYVAGANGYIRKGHTIGRGTIDVNDNVSWEDWGGAPSKGGHAGKSSSYVLNARSDRMTAAVSSSSTYLYVAGRGTCAMRKSIEEGVVPDPPPVGGDGSLNNEFIYEIDWDGLSTTNVGGTSEADLKSIVASPENRTEGFDGPLSTDRRASIVNDGVYGGNTQRSEFIAGQVGYSRNSTRLGNGCSFGIKISGHTPGDLANNQHSEMWVYGSVYLDDAWTWGTSSYGGKLATGLYIGDQKISGGNPADGTNGGSIRLGWREGGEMDAYVYHMDMTTSSSGSSYGESFLFRTYQPNGTGGAIPFDASTLIGRPQNSSRVHTPSAEDEDGETIDGYSFNWPVGEWWEYVLHYKANTNGQSNGEFNVYFKLLSESTWKLVGRVIKIRMGDSNHEFGVKSIGQDFFNGGSSAAFATVNDTYTLRGDIRAYITDPFVGGGGGGDPVVNPYNYTLGQNNWSISHDLNFDGETLGDFVTSEMNALTGTTPSGSSYGFGEDAQRAYIVNDTDLSRNVLEVRTNQGGYGFEETGSHIGSGITYVYDALDPISGYYNEAKISWRMMLKSDFSFGTNPGGGSKVFGIELGSTDLAASAGAPSGDRTGGGDSGQVFLQWDRSDNETSPGRISWLIQHMDQPGAAFEKMSMDPVVWPRGTWDSYELYIKLNTAGQSDGIAIFKINGVTYGDIRNLKWRANSGGDWGVRSASWVHHHGGNSVNHAPSRDSWIRVTDMALEYRSPATPDPDPDPDPFGWTTPYDFDFTNETLGAFPRADLLALLGTSQGKDWGYGDHGDSQRAYIVTDDITSRKVLELRSEAGAYSYKDRNGHPGTGGSSTRNLVAANLGFEELRLTWDMRLSDTFSFGSNSGGGGKMFGIKMGSSDPAAGGGAPSGKASDGGDHASILLNWDTIDSDPSPGRMALYVKHMNMPGAFSEKITMTPGGYWLTGVWSSVQLYVKMNSPGQADGIVRFTRDGSILAEENFMWRAAGETWGVRAHQMNHFYGGNSPSHAPNVDSWYRVDNFKSQYR